MIKFLAKVAATLPPMGRLVRQAFAAAALAVAISLGSWFAEAESWWAQALIVAAIWVCALLAGQLLTDAARTERGPMPKLVVTSPRLTPEQETELEVIVKRHARRGEVR